MNLRCLLNSGTKLVFIVDSCPSRCKLTTLQRLIDQIYLQKIRNIEKSSGILYKKYPTTFL